MKEPITVPSISKLWEPGVTLRQAELRVFLHVLARNKWNRTYTAKALGISIRQTRTLIAGLRASGIAVPFNPSAGWNGAAARRPFRGARE